MKKFSQVKIFCEPHKDGLERAINSFLMNYKHCDVNTSIACNSQIGWIAVITYNVVDFS